jgi:hypothetical protein
MHRGRNTTAQQLRCEVFNVVDGIFGAKVGAVRKLIIIAVAALLATLSLSAAQTNGVARPGTWATAMQTEGLSNFYKVSERLYRSAQPTALGMSKLKELGIRLW